ncbi:MAG: MFS transporter [Bacteroidota bacterium]
MQQILNRYRALGRNVKLALGAQYAVQSVNSAFFLLLNYYMSAEGYADYEVAEVLSYRFLAVFLLAFPLGLYIKGRRLRPFFWVAVLATGVLAHLLVWAVGVHYTTLVYVLAGLWGMGYLFVQVSILPYILLNVPREQHSEAISLSFLSLGGTIFITGTLYTVLSPVSSWVTERSTIQLLATLALLVGIWCLTQLPKEENTSTPIPLRKVRTGYDWATILKASIPSFLIATGAGFTIPVINLFFLHVHGVSSETFAAFGSATWLLVIFVMLLMPTIRRRFGYKVAITLFQSLAIVALFGLAATEWLKPWAGAVWLAGFCYVARQPLMSAASPMASELVMYLVGERNQEIMAALNASIWSGSWFVSTWLFSILRQADWAYSSIFMFTVVLYVIGVSWYAYLIRVYERAAR